MFVVLDTKLQTVQLSAQYRQLAHIIATIYILSCIFHHLDLR